MTRQQIEQVLQNHGLAMCHQSGAVHLHHAKDFCTTVLIDDLLRLQPPAPDEERLERILRAIDESPFAHYTVNGVYDSLRNHFMRWATGGEAQREWCEHLKWNPDIQSGCWQYLGIYGAGTDHWDMCPFADCHAKRPTEGRG